jgi:hypothetical protein
MDNANFGIDWLRSARTQFSARFGPRGDDWAAAHAWDRGSFATFLGMTLTEERLIVHAVGDTICFFVSDVGIKVWPEMTVEGFKAAPALLCSHPGLSAFDDTDCAFENATHIFEAPLGGWAGTKLIVATDAVAEWVIKGPAPEERIGRLNILSGHVDREGFAAWLSDATSKGDVRRDDCTVVVVDL